MKDDITITPLYQPGSVADPLTEIARDGARRMLAAAKLRAEADTFGGANMPREALPMAGNGGLRHGYGPQRSIQTGIGPLDVRRPKVRTGPPIAPEKKVRFTSNILPKWARRSEKPRCPAPVLYCAGSPPAISQRRLSALLRGRCTEPVAWWSSPV